MAGVYKAHNPVSTLEANIELKADDNNMFVNQMLNYSYMDLKSETNYTGTITRAEAIYTIVKMYYSDKTADAGDSSLTDIVDGGSVTLEQALQNPDGGLPSDLYNAILVAESQGLLDSTKSRWDDALTKTEALDFITAIYSNTNTDLKQEIAFNNSESTTENENTESNFEHVVMDETGVLGCSDELRAEVKLALQKAGLSEDHSNGILYEYYTATQDKDNTKIHKDIINNLVNALEKALDAQAQAEKDNNTNNDNNSNKDNNKDNNNNSNKNDNSNKDNNNNNGGGGSSDNNTNEEPDNWEAPPDYEDEPAPGEHGMEFEDGDDDFVQGETVDDTDLWDLTLNP